VLLGLLETLLPLPLHVIARSALQSRLVQLEQPELGFQSFVQEPDHSRTVHDLGDLPLGRPQEPARESVAPTYDH
jgi:hypothetical protein